MNKGIILVCAGIFISLGVYAEPIRFGEKPTPQIEYTKADYYAAIEAYEMATATKMQMAILNHAGFFDESPAIDYAGGPDPYGYMFRDSDEPDGPVYNWVDITATGTLWESPNDDSGFGPLPLPFTFSFYGDDYTQYYIHPNGVLTFTDQYVSWINGLIPVAGYGELIAGLWTDLIPNAGGEVWYGSALVNGMSALVVSWINVPEFNLSDTVTFQIILLSDGTIRFQYDSTSTGWVYDNESVGIQYNDNYGLYISYHENPLNWPNDGLALEIYGGGTFPAATFSGYIYDEVTMDPVSGVVIHATGYTTYSDINGYYEITDMPPGEYDITILCDDYYGIYTTLTLFTGNNNYDWYLIPLPVAQVDPYFTDFESDQGWFANGDPLWQYGQPGVDPPGAYSGIYVWDTMLNGYYPNDAMAWLYTTVRWEIPEDGNWHISYYHWMNIESYYDGYAVLVSLDTSAWWILYPEGGYSNDPGYHGFPVFCGVSYWDEVTYDLAVWEGESVYVAFLFVSDGSIYYPGVAIDNFRIGPESPVEFWIEPVGLTIISPDGGTLVYNTYLENNTENMWLNVLYWTEVMLPNGNMYGPIIDANFSILPFVDLYAPNQTLSVPPGAPSGNYVFYANVGRRPGPHLSSDFPFSKSAVAGQEGGSTYWTGSVPTFMPLSDNATVTAAKLPTEYRMAPVYPNPFNPTTKVSIALPETADLKVTVFNVMGQQVAELANGQFKAGIQAFTINGSALASGIYFVRATVPDRLDAIQKITLMK